MYLRISKNTVKRVSLGSASVMLLTFVCYSANVELASAVSIYMLLVVMHSLAGDFFSSAVIAVLSAGCLDFFFTQPLFSLRVTSPRQIAALLAFSITSLVITRLVSKVREEERASALRKERMDRLYQLSQELLAAEPEGAASENFLEPFRRIFGLTSITFLDSHTGELRTEGNPSSELRRQVSQAYIEGCDLNDGNSDVFLRCLRVGKRVTGTIGFEGLRDGAESANSLAALAAAQMERTSSYRRASAATAAAQTEAYRSALLDALAHEFKTPLATILAAAGGLREAGPLEPVQLEMTDTVENEAARLGSLTSRLLRTVRLDSEEIRPRIELIDLTLLVSHIVAQHSSRSRDRRILLANPLEEVDVPADPELLRLTLNQLVENACKYSRPGSTITVETTRQGDFVGVNVTSDGSSIYCHERSRIFERFYRGAEAVRSTSGSGLGLHVARKIALAHGGLLDLEVDELSEDRVTFSLKIPSARSELNYAFTTK